MEGYIRLIRTPYGFQIQVAKSKKFFAKITSDQVKYDVVDSYEKLMEVVHV